MQTFEKIQNKKPFPDCFSSKWCYLVREYRKELQNKLLSVMVQKSETSGVQPLLQAAGETSNGCVRHHNEDNFCCSAAPGGYLLAAVADGVGGHAGGEIASYLCCHRLLLDWKELFRVGGDVSDPRMARFLFETIVGANRDVVRTNIDQRRELPMCTTVAAALFTPQMVLAAHVGDSRIYCIQRGTIRQLTVDHTLRNDLNERGVTPAEGEEPPLNIISQAVGLRVRLKPEVHSYFRCPDDRCLICSDGLFNCLSDQEILETVTAAATPREATDRLLRAALRRGASDNVTAISIFPQQ